MIVPIGTKVRLKSRKERSASSKTWLIRQLNDPYVRQAKTHGYRSRSAYKLLEIDKKFHLLRKGLRILDLGAAPGGWSQVASRIAGEGHIFAIDLLPMDPLPGVTFFQGDFTHDTPCRDLQQLGPFDVVLSDMAPPTTGIRSIDHIRIMGLLELVFEFAGHHLNSQGAMVIKVFSGGTEQQLLTQIKRAFAKVAHFKPPASRQESREFYLVATGFRGLKDSPQLPESCSGVKS